MKDLIISTLPKSDERTALVCEELRLRGSIAECICTDGMNISHCIGCNDCWIKTPGLCCIKDDYEQILIKLLCADRVLFLSEVRLGFISYQTKTLFDRILPLATMHLKIKDGQMRHYSRYGRMPDFALLYSGEAEQEYLTHWLYRAQLNLHGKSLGAFPFENREAFYHAFTAH